MTRKLHPIIATHKPYAALVKRGDALDAERTEALEKSKLQTVQYHDALNAAKVGSDLPPQPVDTAQIYQHHEAKRRALTTEQTAVLATAGDDLASQVYAREAEVLAAVAARLADIDGLVAEMSSLAGALAIVQGAQSGSTVLPRTVNLGWVLCAARQSLRPLSDTMPDDRLVTVPSSIERPRDR